MYWRFVLNHTDLIFYVSPHLEELVGRKGVVLPFPIPTEAFRAARLTPATPDRDVLYYCPSGEANENIYRLSWIVDYAREHLNEKITIIGNSSHPANYQLSLPNVEIIQYVERSQMPALYKRHKMLIRMTTEDGLARMVHEALLCGLKVIYNGKEMTEVPPEREPSRFAIAFKQAVSTIYR
jgi:glycosyltransferase involved in cell wall biosynthesis